MQQMTIAISGMHCGNCVRTVRNALLAVPGTRVDAVRAGSASVSYDTSQTAPTALLRAIRDAGYEPVAAGAQVASSVAIADDGGCCSRHRTSPGSYDE